MIAECTVDKNHCIPTPSENQQKIEITRIDEKIEKLITSLTEASEISMTYINKEIEKLDKKRNKLLMNISSPRHEAPNKFKDVVFHQLSFEDKKLAVSQFIDRIMVFDDEIEIVWKV